MTGSKPRNTTSSALRAITPKALEDDIRGKMKKGFTLIELMTTIAIFSVIIGAIIGIFIAGVRQQKIALEIQTLLDQTTFSLEFMSRNLRMANKELGQGCLSQRGLNYEITKGGSGVKFINFLEDSDCQEFFLESGQLTYFRQSSGQTLAMTSDKLEISSLNFNLIGGSQQDDIQPRLTLFLEISSSGGIPKSQFQTTISQRKLDVRF